jgi:hypothetical protein
MDLQPNLGKAGGNHTHIDTKYYKENKRMKKVFGPLPHNKLCLALVSHVFLHTFLALHSSARNHATQFSMFFSCSKRFRNNYVILQCHRTKPIFFAL